MTSPISEPSSAPDPFAMPDDGDAIATPEVVHTGPDGEPFRSGFVSFVGRPNAGKSTLLNKILGSKVAIVSNKPQTTRTQVRGVLHRPGMQVVFVDTPGIHKAVSALGARLNDSATATIGDVDVTCLVVDGLAPFGRGDQFIADKMPKNSIVIINKVDRANREQVLTQLAATSDLGFAEYFPVSAQTGEGVDALVEYLVSRIPEGPPYYPADMLSDVPEPTQVAELVREQLFIHTRQELPYSIATRVTEWEWPRIRCEILVERDSQKGMVIGKGGSLLKRVGIAVREQLPEGTFIELHVTVDKDWQRKIDRIEQLGYGES
jgi:GTP-binding protein Era